MLDGEFDADIEHDLLGRIVRGTHSLEYYWLDRWYNIFRFAEPNGKLKSFYCNVNLPPQFLNGVLSYVDLDFDILVQPDFSYRILDAEDFERNAEMYGYGEDIRAGAQQALAALVRKIESRRFPFNEAL